MAGPVHLLAELQHFRFEEKAIQTRVTKNYRLAR